MTAPPRRWFRFSLRTFFVVVTVLAVPCAWVARELAIVRERKAVEQWMVQQRGWYGYGQSEVSWLRKMLGDNLLDEIAYPSDAQPQDIDRVKAAFPDATVEPWPE